MRFRVGLWLLLALLSSVTLLAISAAESDDFEDGTVENWAQGIDLGNVTNVADGGPDGAGDNFMQVVSAGGMGPGSRLAVLNEVQWSGDYNALGTAFTISMQVANLGATPLTIRVGVEGSGVTGAEGGQTRWIANSGFALPADGVWRLATFTLSAADMTQVEGSLTLSEVLDLVDQFRIVSAATPAWQGDPVAATLGVDDIQVLSVPVTLESFSIE